MTTGQLPTGPARVFGKRVKREHFVVKYFYVRLLYLHHYSELLCEPDTVLETHVYTDRDTVTLP